MTSFLRLIEALGPDSELHAVGGWVRDRYRRAFLPPHSKNTSSIDFQIREGDLDIATALMPEEVINRARKAGLRVIPTGLQHGTVTILMPQQSMRGGSVVREDRPIEITTFRGDGPYLDGRHPESVHLGVSLRDDLARRDFTINAMALPIEFIDAPDWEARVVDPFGGKADLNAGLIRAVGDPLTRFAEDGLRPLRACRFASQLSRIPNPWDGTPVKEWPPFDLEPMTAAAIRARLDVCAKVAVERVYIELTKLICGAHPAKGLQILEQTGLLDLWMPELRPMVGCTQNRHHRHDVWNHTLACFDLAQEYSPSACWALLLHDIGKPGKRSMEKDGEVHFYGHETLSVELADQVLARLKAPTQVREHAKALITLHGEYPTHAWSDAAFRRLLVRLDQAGVSVSEWELFRLADQFGKGWAEVGHPDGRSGERWWKDTGEDWNAVAQRLESVRFPGMTVKGLAIDSRGLMDLAGRPGGPWLGRLQNHLLEAVLEDPELNTQQALRLLAQEWLAAVSEGPAPDPERRG